MGINLVPVAAGLQAYYNSLSPFSLPVEILALLIYLGGIVWGSYALLENRFFSGTVRLQTERGHHVISNGPYSIMRHPGYAGALVSYLALPIFLGSLWAFLPVFIFVILLVIRTRLEDRFLQEQLPGYAEYAHKVPWRLVPGIW
jgi:protein-S-isoprenylcysteine O-methyltransferase Ste14